MEYLSEHQIEEFKKAFSHFDANGDGVISISELSAAMKELGHYPTDIELEEMIREVDAAEKKALNFEEFVAIMLKQVSDYEAEEKTIEAFKLFDRQGSGVIRKSELEYIMTTLGDPMKEEEVKDLLELAEDDEGFVDYTTFARSLFSRKFY